MAVFPCHCISELFPSLSYKLRVCGLLLVWAPRAWGGRIRLIEDLLRLSDGDKRLIQGSPYHCPRHVLDRNRFSQWGQWLCAHFSYTTLEELMLSLQAPATPAIRVFSAGWLVGVWIESVLGAKQVCSSILVFLKHTAWLRAWSSWLSVTFTLFYISGKCWDTLLFNVTSFLYPYIVSSKHCSGLAVRRPHRLLCLNAWFLGGGGVWKAEEPLGRAPSLEHPHLRNGSVGADSEPYVFFSAPCWLTVSTMWSATCVLTAFMNCLQWRQ